MRYHSDAIRVRVLRGAFWGHGAEGRGRAVAGLCTMLAVHPPPSGRIRPALGTRTRELAPGRLVAHGRGDIDKPRAGHAGAADHIEYDVAGFVRATVAVCTPVVRADARGV